MKFVFSTFLIFAITAQYSCKSQQKKPSEYAHTIATKDNDSLVLPQPYATKSVQNFSKVIGWQQGKTPAAPQGFTVTANATGLVNPRNVYVSKKFLIFLRRI